MKNERRKFCLKFNKKTLLASETSFAREYALASRIAPLDKLLITTMFVAPRSFLIPKNQRIFGSPIRLEFSFGAYKKNFKRKWRMFCKAKLAKSAKIFRKAKGANFAQRAKFNAALSGIARPYGRAAPFASLCNIFRNSNYIKTVFLIKVYNISKHF